MSSWNLPWCSFELFPHTLLLNCREKSLAPLSPLPLLWELNRAVMLPLSLLLSKLIKPHHSLQQTSQPFCMLGCLPLDVFRCLSIILNFCGPELHTVLVRIYLLITNIEAKKGKNLQVFAFSILFQIQCHFSLLNSFGFFPLFSFLVYSICNSTCSVQVLFKNVYSLLV